MRWHHGAPDLHYPCQRYYDDVKQDYEDDPEMLAELGRDEAEQRPDVHPDNRVAWSVWETVSDCRVYTDSGPLGIAWDRAESVLRMFYRAAMSRLSPEVHRKLRAIVSQLMRIEEAILKQKRETK